MTAVPSGLVLATDRGALHAARSAMTGRVAAVLTMGALHEGHVSLIREARRRADHVVVTVFVNPLQFGPDEDFARYPRDLQADLVAAAEAGADVVFAPGSPRDVWPEPPVTSVDPGPLGTVFEGAVRPGHFAGVCTVVLALLHLTRPHLTVFGEKDWQQLAVVRRMLRDLALDVEVVGAPIVREADGLALSSRNRYLSPAERARAATIPQAVLAGAAMAPAGAPAVVATTRDTLLGVFDAEAIDYVQVVGDDFVPVEATAAGPARLVVAVRVGATRLLDNAAVALGAAHTAG